MKKKIAIIALCVLAFLLTTGIISIAVIRTMGKNRLKNSTVETHPIIVTEETAAAAPEEKEQWKEGWIKYNDKIYEYNDNITTFLFMGIDKNEEVKEVAEGTNGGQADALFLLVMNPDERKLDIIGVNRNTMTDVDIYNEYGDYVTTVNAQIAVQHGFGNGVEESCKYQVEAVRKLMYNLPIHGYAAINMKAIPIINDAVGGVNVEVLNDVYKGKKLYFKQGENVHLEGEDSFIYIHNRDINEFGSADKRLARQKQYLTTFMSQARAMAKDDIGIVSELYNALIPYMVTDITFDEVAYLAPEITGYSMNEDSFHTFEGETKMGEEFEEFYPDEQALYDLIINIYYKEVDMTNN